MDTLNPTPTTQPASNPILYDLLIAFRKYGVGSTTNPDAPIIWWKVTGQPKEKPTRPVSLIHPLIQKRLTAYELVDTEVQVNQVIRKYCRVLPVPVQTEGRPKAEKPRCDAYNPAPNSSNLLRCRKVARYRVTLQSGGDPYTLLRCQACRDELHVRVQRGVIFEILDEETIN